MDALIDLLLTWIGDNSQYDTTHLKHPTVIEVSAEALTRKYYEGRAHLMPADGVEERLNGIYLSGTGAQATIYILPADSIEGAGYFENPYDNPLWREILLHELVHHAQHAEHSESWTCVARSEAEAYEVGGAYFEALHLPDPMPNRSAWVEAAGNCSAPPAIRTRDDA